MNCGLHFLFYGCDQDFLLPPDARDWLPAGHLSWAVINAVGELDLSAFLAYYRSDGQGRPAYHPKMMTALVLYCYCKGIRSSRAVQMACFDDVGCRVITGNRPSTTPPSPASCAATRTRSPACSCRYWLSAPGRAW
ncbi:MAG TPA: transposase [Pseudonocardiaceae bacterium]|jgi:transposase